MKVFRIQRGTKTDSIGITFCFKLFKFRIEVCCEVRVKRPYERFSEEDSSNY